MKTDVHADLKQIKTDILDGMREYMAGDGGAPGYTESDIGQCESILSDFLAKISAAGTGNNDLIMSAVKETVLDLNALNERCGHCLIETDQREQICDLIIQSATAAGVSSGDDITEQWREW